MHLSYSPDFASIDYHLFQSLQNSFNNVKLTSKEACEKSLFHPEITEVLQ